MVEGMDFITHCSTHVEYLKIFDTYSCDFSSYLLILLPSPPNTLTSCYSTLLSPCPIASCCLLLLSPTEYLCYYLLPFSSSGKVLALYYYVTSMLTCL